MSYMKTLKQILFEIKEKFVAGSKMAGAYREVFVNPEKSEIMDIEKFGGLKWGNNVRFIADRGKKEVYTTAGDVMHHMILDIADLGSINLAEHFTGMGVIERGIIVVTDFGNMYGIDEKAKKLVSEDIINGEYDWMERYNFDLSKIKDKAEEYLEE